MDIEKTIQAINEALQRADQPTTTLFDASKSLGALIVTCGYLVGIVEEQQRQIERLENMVASDRFELLHNRAGESK